MGSTRYYLIREYLEAIDFSRHGCVDVGDGQINGDFILRTSHAFFKILSGLFVSWTKIKC